MEFVIKYVTDGYIFLAITIGKNYTKILIKIKLPGFVNPVFEIKSPFLV